MCCRNSQRVYGFGLKSGPDRENPQAAEEIRLATPLSTLPTGSTAAVAPGPARLVASGSLGVHGEQTGGRAGSGGLWLCHWVLWSRRLAQKLEEVVAFRVLAAGNQPQPPTLFEFRWRHRADFGAVQVVVVQLARDLGLVSLATLVSDSTKVRANTGNARP